MHRAMRSIVLLALTCVAPTAAVADIVVTIGGRSTNVHEPTGYDPGVPTPIVLLLHGYSGNGPGLDAFWGITPLADEKGFLFAAPNGTVDCTSRRFWNATDACCNFCGSTVDDVAFLSALIDSIKANYNVDDRRVFLMGWSNGGFMSHRMACDRADVIAAVASMAGATWANPAACAPSEPVHSLQIHGTSDATILYAGGVLGSTAYPGAVTTAETWAGYNGCDIVADNSCPPLDMVANIAGDETLVSKYTMNCNSGGAAELWTMVGAPHGPAISANFSRNIVEWLLAHPKPGPTVSVGPGPERLTGLTLRQNAPNPFARSTTIAFDLPRSGMDVRLDVFDITGQRVRTLADGTHAAGAQRFSWDGRSYTGRRLSAGVYVYRLTADGETRSRKLILFD